MKNVTGYDEEKLAKKGAFRAGAPLIKETYEDGFAESVIKYGMNNGFFAVKGTMSEIAKIKKCIYGNRNLTTAEARELTQRYIQLRAEFHKKGLVALLPVRDRVAEYVREAIAHTERLSSPQADMYAEGMKRPLLHSREELEKLLAALDTVFDGSSEAAARMANGVIQRLAQWNGKVADLVEGSELTLEEVLEPLQKAILLVQVWAAAEKGVGEFGNKAEITSVPAYDKANDQLAYFR